MRAQEPMRLSWQPDTLEQCGEARIRPQPVVHDNSVKTLEELAAFYANLFANNPDFPVQLTVQDQADMVAYLRLLQ